MVYRGSHRIFGQEPNGNDLILMGIIMGHELDRIPGKLIH